MFPLGCTSVTKLSSPYLQWSWFYKKNPELLTLCFPLALTILVYYGLTPPYNLYVSLLCILSFIVSYIIYNKNIDDVIALNNNITQTVSNIIGPFAKLDKIQFVNGLPKTRSGKIMRRILRKIAENDLNNLGDTTTLLDPNVVNEIKNGRI